jgi:hypothetical protein
MPLSKVLPYDISIGAENEDRPLYRSFTQKVNTDAIFHFDAFGVFGLLSNPFLDYE